MPAHSSHSHTQSLGALNPAYRVNRRKSSSSHAVNMAALAAAAKDATVADTKNRPMSQGDVAIRPGSAATRTSAVLVDGPPLSSILGQDRLGSNKARVRRASEGTRLTRGERRRSTNGELRCDKCGKSYKHGSCLTKHLSVGSFASPHANVHYLVTQDPFQC